MNAKLENDLKIINSYVVCHYGVDDQQWGKHDPKRRWQRHAKYAMGRPDPKSIKSTAGAKKPTSKAGDSKDKEPTVNKKAADTFKKVTKEREAADKIKEEIKNLQKSLNEHTENEKRLQEQYERDKKDSRTSRQKRGDLKREQKSRYKEYKKKVAADTYGSIKKLMKESHQEKMKSIKSNVPIEVKYFADRIQRLNARVKAGLTNTRVNIGRSFRFRSALSLDRTLSKKMFNETFSEAEYRAVYNRTRDIFKENYGDAIADIMRPKL